MSSTPTSSTTDRPLTTTLARAPGFVAKRTRRWLVRQYYSRYFDRNPGHRALSESAAKAAAADAGTVLLLCWGNICRSPMAERYLRARLAERGLEGVTVHSAGWGQYADRPSPSDAVASAEAHGVDLGDHRATLLSADLVESVDVAYVMDYNDFHSLTSRYPGMAEDTFFLRALLGDAAERPRIPDPHGRGPERFDEAYATIATAADELVATFEANDG